ncbi:MAG: AAA family ATPase [Ruminococcus sp.]|nr:AAA family ATPase [Ruminococcus sp.]
MKLKINQFQELKAVEVEFPAVIRGRNGAGKSTIKRALAYVLNQQNPETGKTFGNEVYPLNPTTAADIYAEVELEGVGFTLTRRSEPTAQQREKWQKGDQLSVVNVCKLNGVPVKVTEYQQNVDALTKGLDIDSLLKDPKKMRAFLVRLSGMGAYDETPLKEARVKLEKQRKDIDIKSAIIRDNETNIAALREKRAAEANPRAQIAVLDGEVSDLRAKADELTAKMAERQPRLTEEERKANEAINAKIIELERQQPQVAPMPQLVLLPHVHANVEGLQREIDALKYLPEPVKDVTLTAERDRHIAAGEEFAKKAEAAATSEAKCAKCAICTAAATCQSCERLGGTAEEWKEKAAAEYATADELKGIIADKLAMEQDEYAAKMARLQELEEELENIRTDEASKNAAIDDENTRRRAEYDESLTHYKENHAAQVAAWVAENAAKLADLRAQLIVPVVVDVTDLQNQHRALSNLIAMKEGDLTSLRRKERELADLEASIATLTANGDRHRAELADMQNLLVDLTAEVERLKAERLQYYHTLEARINEILPDDITVALFRQNISNDDFTECCDLYFRGSTAMSGAESLVFRATLSQALQRAAGVELPIIIDEAANVVNADLLAELTATGCTLLIPDAAAERLTIQPTLPM